MFASIRPLNFAISLACATLLPGLCALAHATVLTPSGSGYANAMPTSIPNEGTYEEEFFFDGKANVYAPSGNWRSNGKVSVTIKKGDQPYKTRLLVRAPRRAAGA